jgi:hypothetical protein
MVITGQMLDAQQNIYKKVVTSDFRTISLPNLEGTPKQIQFANDIRDKYTAIFLRKINNMNPITGKKEKDDFELNFKAYINNPQMKRSVAWINHHCPRCGCYLKEEGPILTCSNEYCTFEKDNINYVEMGVGQE